MSGLEVTSIVATSLKLAQLGVEIAFGISNLCSRIRHCPKTIQKHVDQVENLIKLAKLIECSSELQTVEIGCCLESCLKAAKTLRKLLEGCMAGGKEGKVAKCLKIVNGMRNEEKILEALGGLEREKSALILCVMGTDCKMLHDVGFLLSRVCKCVESLVEKVPEISQSMKEELHLIRSAVEEPSVCKGVKRSEMENTAAAVLTSLAATDQRAFISQTLKCSRFAFHWFQETPEYISWFGNPVSDLLWVTAGAGCGKTVLAAHISQWVGMHEHFEMTLGCSDESDVLLGRRTPILLSFFFRNANRQNEGTAVAALKAVVNQMIQQDPDALAEVSRRYDLLPAENNSIWTREVLWEVFRCILRKFAQQDVFLVLDAIDECQIDSKVYLLRSICSLVEELNYPPFPVETLGPSLKIFITSRPDEHAFEVLSDFKYRPITERDTAQDMVYFIHSRVHDFAKRRNLCTGVIHKITQFLQDNAHGMFLWVVLVMQELDRTQRMKERLTNELIASKLSKIPLTLVKTYEAILQRPTANRRTDLWSIIRWLVYGKRGLTLTELEAALSLEVGMRWLDFAGDVKFLCGSLIRIDDSRGEVYFLHQTVREFLERSYQERSLEETGGVDLEVLVAEEQLTRICIRYLQRNEEFMELRRILPTLEMMRMDRDNTITEYLHVVGQFLQRYPFLCYAIEHWASHLRSVYNPSQTLSLSVFQLLDCSQRRDDIMLLTYYINHYGNPFSPTKLSPLHLATYCNIPWLVDHYIAESDGGMVFSVSNNGDTPLIWGCEMGSIDCVVKLLDAGADPNSIENDGWSPLHWAGRNGHLDIALLLLDRGADFNHKDSSGDTALTWAVKGGHWDVVDLLEQRERDTEREKLEKVLREHYSFEGEIITCYN